MTRGAEAQELTNKGVFVWRPGAGRLREGDKKAMVKRWGDLGDMEKEGGVPLADPFTCNKFCCTAKIPGEALNI